MKQNETQRDFQRVEVRNTGHNTSYPYNFPRQGIGKSNNCLKLNASKTKCLLVHSPRSRNTPPPLDIQLCGCRIEQVTCFKFLGVIINNTLFWSHHVTHIAKKVSQHVYLLRWLSWFLPSSLLILYLKLCNLQ